MSNKKLKTENIVILDEPSKVVRLLNITTHHPIFQYTGTVATSMQSIAYDYVITAESQEEIVLNDLKYYLLHTPIDVVCLNMMPTIKQLSIIAKWVKEWLLFNSEGLFVFNYPDVIDLQIQNASDFSFEILDLFDSIHQNILPMVDLLITDVTQLQSLGFHSNENDDDNNTEDEPKMLQHEAVYALIELGVKAIIVKGKHENTPKINDKLFTHEGLIMTQEHQRIAITPHGLSDIFSMVCSVSLGQNKNYCDAFLEGSEYIQEVIKQTEVTAGLCDYQKMPNLLFWL